MNSQLRWLHLSDFHVGKDDYSQRKMFDRIIQHVAEFKDRGFVPDVIFLTGDLSNSGRTSEYEMFWLEFALPLFDKIDPKLAERTFAIPGNHDVDRSQNAAFSREDLLATAGHYFDPTSEGARLRTILLPRFAAFIANDLTSNSDSIGLSDGTFSKVFEVNGIKVGVVGLNTAWLCKDASDERNLTPGLNLLEQALQKIQSATLRIVIGHHPIEWFSVREAKTIKSLFGKHSILYLHGHLHEAWAEPTYGSGHLFLSIQSGAAFQARPGEPWVNGLVWGHADLDANHLMVQPRCWNSEQQAWILESEAFHEIHRNGDWWIYPLPGTSLSNQLQEKHSGAQTVSAPKGWSTMSLYDLQNHTSALQADLALRFFNGAVPTLHMALSSSIPRRKIVTTLAARFGELRHSHSPIVTLLLAAGCEGKTTALLQSALEIARKTAELRILRRIDDADILTSSLILPIVSNSRYTWLILLDEADRSASSLFNLIQQHGSGFRGKVHFLIACRDADWRSSRANELPWSTVCTFQQERLAGLGLDDATSIVRAWAKYGEGGLGKLASVPEGDRASKLELRAIEEAKGTHGAFFGALLAVRHGDDLVQHARLMLERLSQKRIPSGGTLKDALTYIALLHGEDLELLSRPVLAVALGCPPSKLYRDVLSPLGQEAAATTGSEFIYTRHRRVAIALLEVLEADFAEDFTAIFIELAKAAILAFKGGEHVPKLGWWRIKLAEHIFESRRKHMGLQIMREVYLADPIHSGTLVALSKMYIAQDAPFMATRLFQEFPKSASKDRAFYSAWATAEFYCDRMENCVLLASYSLCDLCIPSRMDSKVVQEALLNLAKAFARLYSETWNVDFTTGRVAAAVLGTQINSSRRMHGDFSAHISQGNLGGVRLPTLEQALGFLKQGISEVAAHSEEGTFLDLDSDSTRWEFTGLKRFAEALKPQ